MAGKGIAPIIAPPPVLFAVCFSIGYLADRFFPVKILPFSGYASIAVIAVLFLVAFTLAGLAFLALHKNETPAEPSQPTVRVVRQGPFRLTRNPLYIALQLVYVAFAVLVDSIWLFLLVPVLFLLLHFGVVLREERYLSAKFGAEYVDYMRRVRRWL